MENSRNALRRRIEGEPGPGGATGSAAGAPPRDLSPSPGSGEEEAEDMDVDRPVEAEYRRAQQVQNLRERTSRVGDATIDNLWQRYDRAHREREAARRTFDAETSRLLGLDLDDYIQRIEEREQEVQSARVERTYPPQPYRKGKGKGGGKQGKDPDKRQRTGGAPRW